MSNPSTKICDAIFHYGVKSILKNILVGGKFFYENRSKTLKKKRGVAFANTPPHVTWSVEELLSWKICLFPDILLGNPDQRNVEKEPLKVVAVYKPVRIKLLRPGIVISILIEPVLAEDELDSRNRL